MALNRFLAPSTGASKVEVVNPVLRTDYTGTSADNKAGMPESLAMNLGLLPGISRRFLLGDQLATNQETTLGGGLEPGEILQFDRAGVELSIASTSPLDSVGGAPGASICLVRYIDMNGDELLSTFPLLGKTPVALTSPPQFIAPGPYTPIPMQCINFIGVAVGGATGANGTNQGRIYIGPTADVWDGGKPQNIWNVVDTQRAVNNNIHMMIPAAVSSHITQVTMSSDSTEKNDGLRMRLRTSQFITQTGGFVDRSSLDVHILGNVTLNAHSIPGFTPGSVFQITSLTAGGAVVGVSVIVSMADVRNDVYPPTTEGPIIG